MYVCICNAIKDKDMMQTVQEHGCQDAQSLFSAMGCQPQCGQCLDMVKEEILPQSGQ